MGGVHRRVMFESIAAHEPHQLLQLRNMHDCQVPRRGSSDGKSVWQQGLPVLDDLQRRRRPRRNGEQQSGAILRDAPLGKHAWCAVNSRFGGPGVSPAAVFISTAITDPSAFRYNSSFPSPRHRGANPPPSETGTLSPTLTFPVELSERIEATNTSFRPVSFDTYASLLTIRRQLRLRLGVPPA